MLGSKGFDLWADGYDRSVGLSDDDGSYPFAGYRDVLAYIFSDVMSVPGAAVLDLGFGTGVLTARLYQQGCEVYGQDFSGRMLEIAEEKMPYAHLYCGDLSEGLAAPLTERRYDRIIATYSLHHLAEDIRTEFLRYLTGLLEDNGKILIGDVAFPTRAEFDECRDAAGEEWDDEEFYFVADEMAGIFPGMTFTKLSHCAGVIGIPR